jgi:hypothetical protein
MPRPDDCVVIEQAIVRRIDEIEWVDHEPAGAHACGVGGELAGDARAMTDSGQQGNAPVRRADRNGDALAVLIDAEGNVLAHATADDDAMRARANETVDVAAERVEVNPLIEEKRRWRKGDDPVKTLLELLWGHGCLTASLPACPTAGEPSRFRNVRPAYGQVIPRAPQRLRGSALERSMHCDGYAAAQITLAPEHGRHREVEYSKQNGVIGLGPTGEPILPSGLRR